VNFDETAIAQTILSILESNNLRLASWLPRINTFEVELSEDQNFEEIQQQLLNVTEVTNIERNLALNLFDLPIEIKDNLMPIVQANYLNVIRAKPGWEITKGISSVDIAIIDTGADFNHPDLDNQIDEFNCYLFCSGEGDSNGHGTRITGIIAAEYGNGEISGIAPFLGVHVYQTPWPILAIAASANLQDATNKGIRVVNMSWGLDGAIGHLITIKRAIDDAYENDMILIAAAGNDGKEIIKADGGFFGDREYPASYTKVLAVGNTDMEDNIYEDSNYGSDVIFAPGVNILSTAINGEYETITGTSYSSPQVSALAGLILSVNSNLHNDEVMNIITQTADPILGGGLGRINIFRALQLAKTGVDPGDVPLPDMPANLDGVIQEDADGSYVKLTWEAPEDNYNGVFIYRRELDLENPDLNPGDPFDLYQLNNKEIINSNVFTDTFVEEGESYRYYVFSVKDVEIGGQNYYHESIQFATTDVTVEDDSIIPGDMVLVPAGEFQMGCDSTEFGGADCDADEFPPHLVFVTSYYIDKHEVSNEMYAECVDAGGCSPLNRTDSHTRDSYYDNPIYKEYPVIHTTWDQAKAYCQWKEKRLPTEAEWEKAARGTLDYRIWPWGNELPNCNVANYYNETSSSYCVGDTSYVGDYSQGSSPQYGLLNVAGNVWEWTNDWYSHSYYSISPYENPSGPSTGTFKVIRGGAFNIDSHGIRVIDRHRELPSITYYNQGFRCALEAPID